MPGVRSRFGPQRGIRGTSLNFHMGMRGSLPTFPYQSPFKRSKWRGVNLRIKLPRGPYMNVVPKTEIIYFNRRVIYTNWNKINRNPMQRAGNLIRMIARGSIRRRKMGGPPSPPGTPPRSRQPGKVPPFKMIYNLPTGPTGQIIGMVGFFKSRPMGELPVPGLHEQGGYATRSIRIASRWRQPKDPKTGRYLPFPDPAFQQKRVYYPPRPFMYPAFLKARARLPMLWKNSLAYASSGRI